MVKGIGDYFGRIQSTGGKILVDKERFQTVFNEYGIDMTRRKFSIESSVLKISLSPAEKVAVALKKEEILRKLKENGYVITDIK